MTDKDVIERLHGVFPFGNIRGPYTHKNKPQNKPRWRFDAYGPKARNIIIQIAPYLGIRRRARIQELMELK